MPLSRRLFAGAVLALAALAAPALAQDAPPPAPTPMVIYDDSLSPGWNNWSWARTTLSTDIKADVKPIAVEGDAYSALFLSHAPFSTKGYSKLTFYINGGPTGGQTIAIKALADEKAIDPGYTIHLNANTWNVVEVPLSDLGAADRVISGFWWQAMMNQSYGTYYVTVIQLE